MNRAIADINHSIQASLAEQKRETLSQVSTQLEKLGQQTQAAIDAVAKNQATRPVVQTTFSETIPEGRRQLHGADRRHPRRHRARRTTRSCRISSTPTRFPIRPRFASARLCSFPQGK